MVDLQPNVALATECCCFLQALNNNTVGWQDNIVQKLDIEYIISYRKIVMNILGNNQACYNSTILYWYLLLNIPKTSAAILLAWFKLKPQHRYFVCKG